VVAAVMAVALVVAEAAAEAVVVADLNANNLRQK